MPKKSAQTAKFIECMECLPLARVPEGPQWSYEFKLDGYRLQAVKSAGKITLYSRRQSVLNAQFPCIAAALKGLPDETVIDGELVALASDGRPNFNLLQNHRSAESHIVYYAFDVMTFKGRDLMQLQLSKRREVLRSILPTNEYVDLSIAVQKTAQEMIALVREQKNRGHCC